MSQVKKCGFRSGSHGSHNPMLIVLSPKTHCNNTYNFMWCCSENGDGLCVTCYRKHQFYVLKCCVFHHFTRFLYGLVQVPTKTMFPWFYTFPYFMQLLGGPHKNDCSLDKKSVPSSPWLQHSAALLLCSGILWVMGFSANQHQLRCEFTHPVMWNQASLWNRTSVGPISVLCNWWLSVTVQTQHRLCSGAGGRTSTSHLHSKSAEWMCQTI